MIRFVAATALMTVVRPYQPVSSTKQVFGHTLGAAGAIEAALCWLTFESNPDQRLPPHCWDGESDQDALLPGLVTDEDRLANASRHYLMSNSYAFGGSNIAIVLGS